MKKDYIKLTAALLFVVFIGLRMYSIVLTPFFFWSANYNNIIFAGLIILIAAVFIKKYKVQLKPLIYLIFLPLAIIPIFKCWFKVPYIFCHACPRKCPWGILRKYFMPVFLGVNINKRFWCYSYCPFGEIQDMQAKVCTKRISLPKWLKQIRWLFLALTILAVSASYFQTKKGFIFTGSYNFILSTGIVAAIIFALSFVIPRFWCNYFCPIGSFGDIVLKAEKKFKK